MKGMKQKFNESRVKASIRVLAHMDEHTDQASAHAYKSLLDACISLKCVEDGRKVHSHIIKTRFESEILVGKSLVSMYINCGNMDDAYIAFNDLARRDAIMWNSMISGYSKNDLSDEAINFFWKMQEDGEIPNDVTYLNVFKACASVGCLRKAGLVHAEMVERDVKLIDHASNTLVDMYAKCGGLVEAYETFKKMPLHTVVSCNVMISGFAHHGQYADVFKLFRQMSCEGLEPDDYTLVIILRTCAEAESLLWGKLVHDHIIRNEIEIGVYVANSLITMYARCGNIQEAYQVFTRMSVRDLISWNTMIAGFILNRRNKEALDLFQLLIKQECIKPDQATFVSSLKACVSMGELNIGKKIHACLAESGETGNILLISTLIDMYIKCGSINDARKVFDLNPTRNVVVWNTVISGYSENIKEAFKLLKKMVQDGLEPDEVTFLNILKACNNQSDLEHCKLVNIFCVERGHETDLYVGSTLVDVYATSGSLQDAMEVFRAMPERNIVSWNALVGGCVEKGLDEKALELLQQMQVEGVQSDEIAYVNIINACASLADLEQGKRIHGSLMLMDTKVSNLFIGNALVDMYGKCGSLIEALETFEKMSETDLVSWNALISGFAQHGHGEQVLHFAKRMRKKGVKFNNITLVGVLTACSHTGLVEEAQNYFDDMWKEHGIMATPEHYACMVDVLGRAGLLEEAANFVRKMPIEPTSVVWMALLGACRIYGYKELASYAAAQILVTEPENSAAFLLVSSLDVTISEDDEAVEMG